ncbi:CapA family protein [Paenibacillus albiflavus]|uniref:CapA family protein n=1 Tax=Paenibacillus albiflavus TaxID=2545760 RepID=A0A4R4E486_9BACL|nr:CapA family protein [Paenibacillus albiflavus]TCZ74259.1 CapA family protein [Paenibacillus albiflavus]
MRKYHWLSWLMIGIVLALGLGILTWLSARETIEFSGDAGSRTPQLQTQAAATSHEPVHLIFAGDAMMDWSVKEAIREKGPDYPFQYVREEVSAADLAFVNLETAVTTHRVKDTNQIYNFKSDPISLSGIKNAGFDLVSISNNHVLDYKQQGFLETLQHLEQTGLRYVGGGRNKEQAYAAQLFKIKGQKIKILAFSRFIPTGEWFAQTDQPGVAEAYNKNSVLPVIKRERAGADYLLVYMHWGVEKTHTPQQWQREYAYQMIDAGADAIIGSHVHVLQGYEFYHGKPIAYSIGNFLFPDYVKGAKADTGLLNVTLRNGKVEMAFKPYLIKHNQVIPQDQNYEHKQLKFIEAISKNVEVNGYSIQDRSAVTSSADKSLP